MLIGKDFWEMGSNTSTFKLETEITPLMKWAIWWLKQEFLFILLFFLQQEVATEDMYKIFEK